MKELLALSCATLCGITVAITLARLELKIGSSSSRALASYLSKGEETEEEGKISKEGVILAALGLPQKPELLTVIKVGAGVIAGLIALMFKMPIVIALGAGALIYVLISSWLEAKWQNFRLEIEKELPTFISRLGGTLLVTQAPLKAMEEVTSTLDEKSSLRLWMEKFISGVRVQGWQFAERAREEAALISPSLALVIFQLKRLFETGGTGFVQAFATTADELSAILEARAVAASKAEGARGAVRMMLFILGAILMMLFSSPQIRQGFADPTVQVITIVALGTMAFGYIFLNGMIDEAMEG